MFKLALYYGRFIDALEDIGYRKDIDLLGASYDWRKAPSKLIA